MQLTPRRHALSLARRRPASRRARSTASAPRSRFGATSTRSSRARKSERPSRTTRPRCEVMGSHRAVGRLKGSVGGWVLDRAFDAVGAEALSPAVDQSGFAAFVYEEVTWPHVTLQFGGRVDRTNYAPAGETERDFTSGSVSGGLLFRPAAADDRVTIAVERGACRPQSGPRGAVLSSAPHPGNFAFEVGNPDLKPEHALGFDLSLRWRAPRASGEVTYFRNDIRDFVFTAPVITTRTSRTRRGGVRRAVPGTRHRRGRRRRRGREEFPYHRVRWGRQSPAGDRGSRRLSS